MFPEKVRTSQVVDESRKAGALEPGYSITVCRDNFIRTASTCCAVLFLRILFRVLLCKEPKTYKNTITFSIIKEYLSLEEENKPTPPPLLNLEDRPTDD